MPNQYSHIDPVTRFWSHVNKTETCWLWTGATDKDGYGVFSANGKMIRAHVYSWVLHFGPVPTGHGVLHRCDTPPCVRPDTLFTGTTAHNMADKVAKGRQANGARQWKAKLTDDIVRAMRLDRSNGLALKALAAKYGVHFTTVHDICKRKTWHHVI